MKIIVKQLQGEEITLDVELETEILDVKKMIEKKLKVKVATQGLLLMGKKLSNETTIGSHLNIKDGTKLYLIIQKPPTLQEAVYNCFKNDRGMSEAEARKGATDFVNNVNEKFNSMSWDEVNMLCLSCMGRDLPPREIWEARETS